MTAKLSNPDTYGPGGSVVHLYGPDDTSSVTTTLSPTQQQVYDNQQNLDVTTSGTAQTAAQRMSQLLGTPLSTQGLPGWGGSVSSAGLGMTDSLSGAGQGLQGSIAGAGQGIQSGFSSGQPLATVGGAGQGMQSTLGGAGQGVQTGFDGGQPLQRLGTADFGQQSQAVQDAIMSRMQPQLDRQGTALRSQLAAQGFTVGSAGYDQAMDQQGRDENDAQMQAVLAGGQEQSRLFGLQQAQAGFNNAASTTETNQQNAAQQAGNTAQQQAFGQDQAAADFQNQAQNQAFTQQTGQAGFNNQASETETQGYNAALAAANQAQQQGFAQDAANADLANQAQGQAFGQQAAAAGFQNSATAQTLNQQLAVGNYADQQRQQQLAERLQLRAQPVNEVSALFGLGNGVQMPTQGQVTPAQVAAPDYQGLVESNYKTQAGYAAQSNAAIAQAIGNGATAAATAYSGGRK